MHSHISKTYSGKQPPSVTHNAVLVMESQNRSEARLASSRACWTRLYQAGKHYLDLSLVCHGQTYILTGTFVPGTSGLIRGATVTVIDKMHLPFTNTSVLADGSFILYFEKADLFHLNIRYANMSLTLNDLYIQ